MKYLLIAAIALMACSSDDPTAPYPPTVIYINDAGTRAPAPMPTTTVSVWVQDHEFLPLEGIFEGCDYWLDVGVACMSTGPAQARIRVYVDESACDEEHGLVDPATGKRTLGLAWYDTGDIMLFARCFFHKDSNFIWYHQGLRNLSAHEVGHTLGISHAADNCEGEILSWTDQNVPICGRAIMNPYLDYTLTGLTGVDLKAFQFRTRAGALRGGVDVLEAP